MPTLSHDEARNAFEIAERAKARALLDLLQLGGVPEQESSFPMSAEEGRIITRREEAQPCTLEQIQQNLPEGTALLEYYVSDTLLLGFVVTRHHLEAPIFMVRKKSSDEIAEILRETERLYTGISQVWETGKCKGRPKVTDVNLLCQQSQTLYRKLVKPTESAWRDGTAQRLIIVPHGTLHCLPFCALFDGEKFLVEQIPLSQSPSASALYYLYRRRPQKPLFDESYLGLANPTINPPWRDVYGSIPKCEDVVKEVAQFFNDNQVKLLIGIAATRKNLLDNCSRYTFVDLECHGDYDAYDPFAAAVVLRGEDGEPSRLTLLEIMKEVRFHPDLQLLTLAICYGAEAEMTAGDDPLGLIRAFFAVGARSILACRWKVPDEESTKILLKTFYERLIEKGRIILAKDKALQQAQIDLIERGRGG